MTLVWEWKSAGAVRVATEVVEVVSVSGAHSPVRGLLICRFLSRWREIEFWLETFPVDWTLQLSGIICEHTKQKACNRG